MRNAIKSLIQRRKSELCRLCRIDIGRRSKAGGKFGQRDLFAVQLEYFFCFAVQKGRRPDYEVCLFRHWMGQAIYTKCKFLCPRAGLERQWKESLSMVLRFATRMPAAARNCFLSATYGTSKLVP